MDQEFGPQDTRAQFLPPEEEPRRRLRGPVFVVLVMVLSAGGLWIAYTKERSHAPGNVPVIQAEAGATKTRPQQPGGMAIPDQDKLIYSQGKGQPQVEKLLPPPETPLPSPAPPPEAATPAAPADNAAMPAPAASMPPVPAPVAVAPTPTAASPAAPSPAPVVAPPNPTVAPSSVAVRGGGFRLQLGAFRNEEAARHEWEKLKKANGDLLGAFSAVWPRADLGARGIFYRVQAGPVADGAAAERLCGELKRRNVGCIVVRP